MRNQIRTVVEAEIKNLHENGHVAKVLIDAATKLSCEDCALSDDIIRDLFFDEEMMYAYTKDLEDVYVSKFEKLIIDLNFAFPNMEANNDDILKTIEAAYNMFLFRILECAVVSNKFLVEA